MANIGRVWRRPVLQDLDLPPFQNNVGVDPGKSIKTINNQVIFIDRYRKTVKIYWGKSFSLNPDGEGMSEI